MNYRARFEKLDERQKFMEAQVCGDSHKHEFTIMEGYNSRHVLMYKSECLNCGKRLDHTFSHKFVAENFDVSQIPASMDRAKYYKSRHTQPEPNEQRDRRQAEINAKWWMLYDEYLSSEKWQEKRKAALLRTGGKCELCGEEAHEVHHLTYRLVGDEDDGDLMPVCCQCHKNVHLT